MRHTIKEAANGGFWCGRCGAYLGINRDEITGICVELDEVEAAQKRYEENSLKLNKEDTTPEICGYYGRACRRLCEGSESSKSSICILIPLSFASIPVMVLSNSPKR